MAKKVSRARTTRTQDSRGSARLPRRRRRTRAEARRLFRDRVRRSLQRQDEAFKGKYRKEIEALSGLSLAELAAIIPKTTDLRVYNALIAVVEEASRVNLVQADLRNRIEELGEVAVAIARKVPGLASIFGD